MKVSIVDGQICYKMLQNWLVRFGRVEVVDKTNGCGLDFVKKIEGGFRSIITDMEALIYRRTGWKFA